MTGKSVASQVAPDEASLGGLLHDLGHQMMTVSLLAESLQSQLPEQDPDKTGVRRKAELMMQETARAMNMLSAGVAAGESAGVPVRGEAQLFDVRDLAAEVARISQLRYSANVRLLRGPPAYLSADPVPVFRVLANLTGNAARAAGPAGHVELSISRGTGTIVEIADDGAGFGTGPTGVAGRGLSVVAQLLAATGGELEIRPGRLGGTSARAIFGGGLDRVVLPGRHERAVIA